MFSAHVTADEVRGHVREVKRDTVPDVGGVTTEHIHYGYSDILIEFDQINIDVGA